MRAPIECLFAAPHLQGVAGRCSVLHSVAVCCSVHVDICRLTQVRTRVSQCVAVCCGVLLVVAVLSLPQVGVCCSVLQCVAECIH